MFFRRRGVGVREEGDSFRLLNDRFEARADMRRHQATGPGGPSPRASALLAASQWLHAPSVEYLVPFVVATGAAVVLAIGTRGDAPMVGPRLFAAARGVARWQCRRKRALARSARVGRMARAESMRGLDALKRRSRRVHVAQRGDGAARAGCVGGSRNAFDELAPLATTRDETGVVLLRGNKAFAWAGTVDRQSIGRVRA